MIKHRYVNASDNPGQYAADRIERQAVTVEWYFAHMLEHDAPAWIFTQGKEDVGLDPWTIINGIDVWMEDARFILEYGRAGEVTVERDSAIYVQRSDIPADAPDRELIGPLAMPWYKPQGSSPAVESGPGLTSGPKDQTAI